MKYSETDLEILYNAKTLFYEIGHNDQPVKHSNIVSDNHGNLLHIGIRDGKYNICYYIFVGDSTVEECIAGQKLLLKLLNNGNIEPIESGIDTENIFNSSFNESIKKIIKEEVDEFEWAKDIVSKDFSYRPDGRRPQKNEKIRIISEDPSWLAEYEECFENPKDITVTVVDQGTIWINVSSMCDYGANQYNQYRIDFYVPFGKEFIRYGITILPYLNS